MKNLLCHCVFPSVGILVATFSNLLTSGSGISKSSSSSSESSRSFLRRMNASVAAAAVVVVVGGGAVASDVAT